jgi:putative copper export protein
MRIRVALILDMLHALALSLWLGGVVMLVFAVFPTAITAKGSSALALPVATDAGGLIEICGLVLVGVQFVLRRRYQQSRPHFIADGVRQLLTFGAFFLAEFVRYSLLPAMAQTEAGEKFTAHISRHITLSAIQIVLLVFVTGISAWLMLPPPRAVVRPVAESSPSKPASGVTRQSSK